MREAKIDISLEGAQELIRNIRAYDLRAQGRVMTALDVTAIEVEANVKRRISYKGGGRTYQRRSVMHQASAPGEPPATDTGRLRASYRRRSHGRFTRDVYSGVEYAPYLEFGTRRIKPRPHLKPSWDEEQPKFVQRLKDAVRP